MKLEVNKFKLKRVILSSFVLLVSFASALTATYAWFTVKRDADSSLGNISISDSVNKYEAFYYSGNFTTNDDGETKYTGYQKPDEGTTITGKQYATDFIKFDPTSKDPTTGSNTYISLPELFPDTRYSFSMEITLNPGVTASSCGLAITAYSASNVTNVEDVSKRQTIYKVDPNNPQTVLGGIYLSEAIDVYASAVIKPSDATLLNTYTNNFLNGKECLDNAVALTDKFKESGDGVGFGGCDLASVNSNDLGGKTVIVFFTVEFSNEKSTFYAMDRREGNNIYYKKDEVNGSSNCYQLLNFNLDMLSLFAK